MTDFDPMDVWTVARAVLAADPDYWDNRDLWTCYWCCAQATGAPERIQHTTDCPRLVAQDLLTGAPMESVPIPPGYRDWPGK